MTTHPCYCRQCDNYIIAYNSCMVGYVTNKTYWPKGCDHYTPRSARELTHEQYERKCKKCRHSVMCDMVIWGIPYCINGICKFEPKVVQ